MVLATHELDEAERLADRVVIFDGGQVIADGTLAELRKGHDEIRFRSDPDLDLHALAAAIGMVASQVGADEYVIDAPPHPRLMAQLTAWLADQGHPLTDLRAGGAAAGGRVPPPHRRPTTRTDADARAAAPMSRFTPSCAPSCSSPCATASSCCSRSASR